MERCELGTLDASEQLIKDLYIDLRKKVNEWSEITLQTPQARMGYIGQHLVSVVTGYPGGKSGARGYDLIIDDNHYGEIKTCYRVDQLGKCGDCGAVVSSLEKKCSSCGSTNIIRKNDSKWLIAIQNEQHFSEILDPYRYYFVLFEFEEIERPQNNNILATIWEVDPTCKGFGYCIIDYYENIRAKSESHAPFNMWPHSFKFALTQPELIYQSLIKEDGTIKTRVFPTMHNQYIDELKPLPSYSRAKTLTIDVVKHVLDKFAPTIARPADDKKRCLEILEQIRCDYNITNEALCNAFADEIYLPLLVPKKQQIPAHLKQYYSALQKMESADS